MRAERPLLRIGEYLVGRACQQLPRRIREQRYQEWVAELPVILHDPQIGPAPRRVVRMLGYAADTVRGAALAHARAHARWTAVYCLLLVAALAVVVWSIVVIVGAPGDLLNYVRLAWGVLLAAFPLSMLMRSAWRVSRLIANGATCVGVAVNIWVAAQSPADWVNYVGAALLFLLLLATLIFGWVRSQETRTRQARR